MTVSRMFTPGFVQPQPSSQKDITIVSTHQNSSLTAFEFRRSLKAECGQDKSQQDISPSTPFWLIFALGTSKSFGSHSNLNRGQKLLDLSGTYFYNQQINVSDPDISFMNLTTNPLSIPVTATSYCYTWYDFSNMTKHHIIQENPIIRSPYLHHYNSYVCDKNPQSAYQWISPGGQNTCNMGKYDPSKFDIYIYIAFQTIIYS